MPQRERLNVVGEHMYKFAHTKFMLNNLTEVSCILGASEQLVSREDL